MAFDYDPHNVVVFFFFFLTNFSFDGSLGIESFKVRFLENSHSQLSCTQSQV